MQTSMHYQFASDNTAGAAPEAMAALNRANAGFSAGYGADSVTAKAADLIRDLLDADVDVRFIGSGTGANAIALATLCRPFEAALAHQLAHVCTDETGAPGYFGQGLGLIGVKGESGKINPAALDHALAAPDVPNRQSAAALSLTNATEFGTVYTESEIGQLTDSVKRKSLGTHLDGARLANAAAAQFNMKSLKDLKIDILVIGGTKSGMPPTEAVVIFTKSLARRFDARLKQAGQLPSKGRFLSAPWIGMLEEDAWIGHARHANAMARKLASLMPFKLLHPVETNAVFVEMDEAAMLRLRELGWIIYRGSDGSARFMCSWATSDADVEEVGKALRMIV